jgi:hypothetical protein
MADETKTIEFWPFTDLGKLGGTDFWDRARTELARRQATRQIEISERQTDISNSMAGATDSMACWTRVLGIFAILLTAAAIALLLRRDYLDGRAFPVERSRY